jgi:hypothetical protein
MRKFAKAPMAFMTGAFMACALLTGFGATSSAQTWQETHPPRVVADDEMIGQHARSENRVEDAARPSYEDNRIGQHEDEIANRNDRQVTPMDDSTLTRPENAATAQFRHE